MMQSALEAVCRAARASVVVVAPGQRPELVAGQALRWLRGARLADRLGRPLPRLSALMRLARGDKDASGVFPLGARRTAEVIIEQVQGPLCAVVVRARAVPGQAGGRREDAVAARVAEGLSNKEIAAGMGISERAVKKHVERARGRLGARNRAHLVALLQRSSTRPG